VIDPQAEKALADRIRKGDGKAFAVVIEEFSSSIFRQARAMLATNEEAEDATQEVFARAFRAMHSLRGDRIRPWLGTITHNQCLDQLKKRQKEKLLPVELSANISKHNSGCESNGGNVFDLPLEILSPVEREVLVLRVMDQQSYKEIADQLRMTEGSLRNIFSRATARLREEWNKNEL